MEINQSSLLVPEKFLRRIVVVNQKQVGDLKKKYKKPEFEKLGDIVRDTLPGGSKGTEGASGKGHTG